MQILSFRRLFDGPVQETTNAAADVGHVPDRIQPLSRHISLVVSDLLVLEKVCGNLVLVENACLLSECRINVLEVFKLSRTFAGDETFK